jgi:phenylpyruvate tautomerase PptA (4-oxalocrotonate tautomerase family)
MPLYTVSTTQPVPRTQRQDIAKLIMRVHCDLTGAPETFVNVVFSSNVPLEDGVILHVLGAVRKGRTSLMKDTLQQAMIERLCELMRVPQFQMQFAMHEVPSKWVMEGGEVLPEPGEEALCEWLQAQHRT